MICSLFRSEGNDGIFLCGARRGDNACNERQNNADGNENERYGQGEDRIEVADTGEGIDDKVDGESEKIRYNNAEKTGRKTDDNCLCVKHARNISLRCADSAENTDLFRSFLNGDKGDNADHDGRNDERDRNERDEDVCYCIDDGCNRRHHYADIVNVTDLRKVIDIFVIVGDKLFDDIFIFEA